MAKDLGRISQLKISLDTLNLIMKAFSTIDKELQTDHFKETLEIYEKAKIKLQELKNS